MTNGTVEAMNVTEQTPNGIRKAMNVIIKVMNAIHCEEGMRHKDE